MKKILSIILILSFFSISNANEIIDIIDLKGRNLKVPLNPKKIIAIGPGALRLITYLQAQDKIIGIESVEKFNFIGRPYILANPRFQELPICTAGGPQSINKKPDLEAIIALKPEIIFATYLEKEIADEIQNSLQIPVIVLDYGELGTLNKNYFYKSLKLAGKILDKEKRADEIINYIDSLHLDLKNKTQNISNENKPSVFVGGIGFKGSQGIESTEKNYLPLDWIFANNLIKNMETKLGSHIFLDKEILLQMNPDIIFIDAGGFLLIKEDYLKKSSYYNSLKAFKENKVFILFPFNSYTTNVETVLVDAYAIAKILYPKNFETLDLKIKAEEIYEFFLQAKIYEKMANDYGDLGESFLLKIR